MCSYVFGTIVLLGLPHLFYLQIFIKNVPVLFSAHSCLIIDINSDITICCKKADMMSLPPNLSFGGVSWGDVQNHSSSKHSVQYKVLQFKNKKKLQHSFFFKSGLLCRVCIKSFAVKSFIYCFHGNKDTCYPQVFMNLSQSISWLLDNSFDYFLDSSVRSLMVGTWPWLFL